MTAQTADGPRVVDARIQGVCPVLAVPFTDGGDIDLAGFRGVVRHALGTGATAVMLFGFASEFYKLTDDERSDLQTELLRETSSRSDIAAVISITHHSTEVAVCRAKEAAKAGADALNVLPPYLLGPSRAAVLAHLNAVLDAVDIPVIVQYAPSLTGTSFEAKELSALARIHRNLGLVKVESMPPGRLIFELMAGNPPLSSLVGNAGLHLMDALARGAVGVQPGCSFTEIYIAIWRAWDSGDHEGARGLHRRLLPYLTAWVQNVELIVQVEKTILQARGIIASDRCRRPNWTLDEYERGTIAQFLHEFANLLV